MNWMRRLLSRRKIYGELSEEIRGHLEEKTAELVAGGMPREEAEVAARRVFGNVTLAEEDGRDVWKWLSIEKFFMDARYSLRMLRKNPGFTVAAVLTLALGIGANAALFSVIDAVLLRPLPFRDPERLVAVHAVDIKDAAYNGEISYPAFLDWRSRSHSFEAMSVWWTTSVTYTGGTQAVSVRGVVVSANLLSLLGVSPALGRSFVEEEDQPRGEQLPVILSYEFWQGQFGGDANILGRSLTLDDQKYVVVGVMPARFQFPVQANRVELWTTIARDMLGKSGMATQRGVSYLQVIARLKPGVSIPQAQSDVALIQEQMNRQYPEDRPRSAAINTESEQISGSMRPALMILLGAVGFVLLIACANVASLLLARAAGRQKEFAIRSALGASRGTIVRQLLTESLLLAMIGGVLGLLLAHWATSALIALAPEGLARTSDIALDLRVLGFTFLVALVTGVLFGLVPAVQASRCDLNRGLEDSGRGSSSGAGRSRLRNTLVVSQLAIAFVLLIGAGLLLRSFNRLQHVDPGFRADHVLTFLLEVPSQHHPGAQRPAFVREILQTTRALPGVKSATAVFGLPLSEQQDVYTAAEAEGHPLPRSQRPRVGFRIIESQYFSTMGIRVVEGRAFTPQDELGGRSLAIVNETLARLMFKGEDPIGRRIKPSISFGESDDAPMREIVGVVADVKSGSIAGKTAPEIYVPQTPVDFIGEMTVVVRAMNDPNSLVPAVRSLVNSMDKDIPMRQVKTLDQYVSGSISAPRFEAVLLGTFAGLAFVLTAVGLYGVISYSVAQRTREMGIRIALGAPRGSISRMVVRQGALLALVGGGVGLIASVFAVQLIRGLLFGIGSTDPATFIAVPLLLLMVALLASYVPARRATKVDPIVALRYE
ncbi:MAG TPA: ABC transporter permease [Candidatus Acidoferrum sp.]|nr:ABC transporter permease [Candidatus Acidoferrum sp.]